MELSSIQIIVKNICDKIKDSSSIDIVSMENEGKPLEKSLLREISTVEKQYQQRLNQEFFGNGPLDLLLADEYITEIIINSWKDIWFEKNGNFFEAQDVFLSETTYHQYVQRICKKLGIQLTFDQPFVCVSYENLRYHIVSPSVTNNDYSLSIRKHRNIPWSFNEFIKNESVTEKQLDCILKIISDKKNFLVIGPTGSGKTTFLNCCMQNLKKSERCVLIEDTSELVCPNLLSTKLLTRKDSHGLLNTIDLTILVKEALRMRPDRLVLGEVRGPEAKDLLLALSTGHEGSMGTLHANSAHEALIRLEMLIQLGAPQWSLEAIRRLIFLSLHYIIAIHRDSSGKRVLKSIHKVSGIENFGILLDDALDFKRI